MPWRGLTPLSHVVRNTRSFATWVRFVFAPVIAELGTRQPWDKAEGLRRRKPGLVPYLPLAPYKLHYEHTAPQNYPVGFTRVGALLQSE